MKSDRRNYTLDLAKFIAAWGVIVIHVGPGDELAREVTRVFTISAVPFFLICSLFFIFRRSESSFKQIAVSRLLIPYICWSILYLGLRFLKNAMMNEDETFDWIYILFFGGASTGLYFLPLLLGFQFMAVSIKNLFLRGGSKFSISLSLGLIVGLYCLSTSIAPRGYLGFTNLFWNAILYCLIAAGTVQIHVLFPKDWRSLSGTLLVAGISLTHSYMGGIYSAIATPLGAAALLYLCLHYKGFSPGTKTIAILTTSYGVYLSHQLYDRFLEVILPRFGIAVNYYTLQEKLVFSILILFCAVVTVLVLRRIPFLKFAFLGERN